jgi:transcriptional regulator with XRE-family HTH domain
MIGSVYPETPPTYGMDVKNRVALRIKTIRKGRGLSQEDMAALINRSPDTISNLERGVSIPTYETLDELAKGLKVPLADFFLDEDTETAVRAEAMARLTDAARQLDDHMLATAAAIMEVLIGHAKI